MDIVSRLKEFLGGGTIADEFVIASHDLRDLDRYKVQELNVLIETTRAANKDFVVDPAREPGDYITIKKVVANNLYEGGEADGRLTPTPEPDNPFRPRYRKLAQNELDHHDRIKFNAMVLLDDFRNIPGVRKAAGNDTDGEGHANLKLAQRHLEDAVYRAVKALTA